MPTAHPSDVDLTALAALFQGFLAKEGSVPDKERGATVPPIDDPYAAPLRPRFQPRSAFDPWNGTAAFQERFAHTIVSRFRVKRVNLVELVGDLRSLGKVVASFQSGLDRLPPRIDSSDDYRGFATSAFVGFTRSFFWDRETDTPRFAFDGSCLPRHLTLAPYPLPESVADEADVCVILESANRSLVIEGAGKLLRMAEASACLELIDVRELFANENYRERSSIPPLARVPTYETLPSVEDTTLSTTHDEDLSLQGSSYVSLLDISIDSDAWRAMTVSSKQLATGLYHQSSVPMNPLPPDSWFSRFADRSLPPLLSRQHHYMSITGSSAGLEEGMFLSYFQRRPAEQFHRVYDNVFHHLGSPAALFRQGIFDLRSATDYFLPHGLYALYPGHQFVAPDLFRMFHQGRGSFALGHYAKAIDSYSRAITLEPTFAWAYVGLAEAYTDLTEYSKADDCLRRALSICGEQNALLTTLGWLHYRRGEYSDAAQVSRTAAYQTPSFTWQSFAYHDLAASLLMLDEVDDALVAIRRAVDRANIILRHCFTFAIILERSGSLAQSEVIYDRTIEVAQWLRDRQLMSPRDRMTVFDLVFVRGGTTRSGRTLEDVKWLLTNPNEKPYHFPTTDIRPIF